MRVGGVLAIEHDLPFGFSYYYTPRPDAISSQTLSALSARARGCEAVFLKIDPREPLPSGMSPNAIAHALQYPATVLIDCSQDKEKLLGAMHPKTRYNIRIAERHDVTTRQVLKENSAQAFEMFFGLLRETAYRESFSLHPKEHYRILLDHPSADFQNELWFAERDGTILAAALVNWYAPARTVTYLHGASSRIQREVMAPQLLHWKIIQAAGARGYSTYDLGGIDEVLWPGVTRFKKGFGGRVHTYPPARDYIFRPRLYSIYRWQRKLRNRA